MSFADTFNADFSSIVLNTSDFAEIRTVKYDGEIYADIPVVLTRPKQTARQTKDDDHMEGVHVVTAVLHCKKSDLGGNIPEQKQMFYISDGKAVGRTYYRKYRIAASSCRFDMIRLELEAYDE
ncbi:MAG: hypothetical protein IJK23_09940 [Clostridia bacterium]|nr:hypothetical protein [Clostridia bacterium]